MTPPIDVVREDDMGPRVTGGTDVSGLAICASVPRMAPFLLVNG